MEAAVVGFSAALIGALVGALASIMTTRLTLDQQRELLLADQEIRRTTEFRRARVDAYIELSVQAHLVWVALMEMGSDDEDPLIFATDREWIEALATAQTMASSDVGALIAELRHKVSETQRGFIERAQADSERADGPNSSELEERRSKANERYVNGRNAVREFVDDLRDRIRLELDEQSHSTAD